ncbi:MAG: hypothetical protein FWG35_05610 [Spirochaetaceae bacterium]|nr:hypothetical protein [Spirochaetaceae bacterium]
MMKTYAALIFFFIFSAALCADEGQAAAATAAPRAEEPARSQPGEEFFSELKQVLSMNIAARISEAGEDAVWKVESSKNTISGRSVSVKLVGDNIVVLADFTPYVDADSSIVLVAQAQVWISPQGGKPLEHFTALKSLPVRMGEKVLFFPLGVTSMETNPDSTHNIELEIHVLPSEGPS